MLLVLTAMKPGALCISIDLELAWGIWDKPSADYHARCAELERTIVDRLMTLFERYEVSATWAIVSALLDPNARDREAIWFAPDFIRICAVAPRIVQQNTSRTDLR